jgi:hypothetical protein
MLKKITFVLMLSIAQSIIVFGYCSEPDQASIWYGFQYYHSYPQEEHAPVITNITYSIGTDTLINDKQYLQIRYIHEAENITNTYRGSIRQSEDRQQMYFVPNGSNKEYLLYDYSVNQGDTVYAYAGFNDKSCEEMVEHEPDRSITPAWIVMRVQTIDGRKHILVQNDDTGVTIEWIEGIGTKHILWAQGRDCYATGMDAYADYTLCAADSEGNILYSFNTDEFGIRNNCPDWEVLAIEKPVAGKSSARKFLRNGQLLILRGNKIYTVTGQVVE